MPTAWLHCIGVCRRPASAIVGRCKPCSYGAHSPLRRMPSCWRLRWDMHNERVRKCAQCACACACACVRVRRVPFPVGQTDRWALRCLCLFRCGGGLHSPTVRAPAVSALSHSRTHACGYTHARTHASTHPRWQPYPRSRTPRCSHARRCGGILLLLRTSSADRSRAVHALRAAVKASAVPRLDRDDAACPRLMARRELRLRGSSARLPSA